ncbi:NlpC/P60 family protein [Corynebacterium hansenii]|uniref:NlpC/P60 family protein n=1 Tax=Corynebacterium hansenii TaxID=394964 RepID=A0ABV7ZNP8_9CORY|nr:NlpC/P60 family protein [Corynebacterium hansenii]WJZ00375.1 putative endopeptidase precursor [Corynebacterium hansenii]
MGKHQRRSNLARNAAAFGATVAGITALTAPTASAAPVAVPGVGSFDVPGVENIAGAIPGGNFLGDRSGGISPAAVPSVSTGQKIVDAARSQIGTPYVWGGTQPGGFDCSGLTSWSYQQVGKSIPRTSQAQAQGGQSVGMGGKQLGDIIVFYPGATHVGIFSGGNNVIHAPQEGQTVHEASIDYMPVHSVVRY